MKVCDIQGAEIAVGCTVRDVNGDHCVVEKIELVEGQWRVWGHWDTYPKSFLFVHSKYVTVTSKAPVSVPNNEKITMAGAYKTTKGQPVRVLCVDSKSGVGPVVVLVRSNSDPEREFLAVYDAFGKHGEGFRGLTSPDLVDANPFKYLKKDDVVYHKARNEKFHVESVGMYCRCYANGKSSKTADENDIAFFDFASLEIVE